ncbi:MAG: DNRLRE domain-containing protein [Lysobacterales bacterium]
MKSFHLPHHRLVIFRCFILAPLIAGTQLANAQTTISLSPTLDNSVFEELSDNSAGAEENLFVGITNNGDERRALIAFQDFSAIAANSTITGVELTVAVTRGVGPSIDVALFATTTAWGEGSSNPTNAGGQGAPAQAGDATWDVAMFPRSAATSWQTPGGDFDPNELSRASVGSSGTVTFPSTAPLVAQVQNWLDGGTNSGLILISQLNQNRSAKRLGSRENGSPANRPTLEVTYTTAAATQPLSASGLWFDASVPGDGFNVIESPQSPGQKGGSVGPNNITVFYFGYDASGARLWLVSDTIPGPFRQNEALSFPMLVGGTSGNFQTPAPGSELTNWGTLEVTLSDCVSGTFQLNGADGNKRFEASQLTAVDGLNCSITR